MHEAFKVHKLNALGLQKAETVANIFDAALAEIESVCSTVDATGSTRYMAIVRTKMEEACFFAKKAVATNPINQQ